MASVVDICNYALSKVGENTIISLDEGTPEANRCKALYPLSRDSVLRIHPWNCVIKRARIASSVDDPEWGFDKSFPLPADNLRLLDVDTVNDWRVESNSILADTTGPLDIRYISRVEDSQQYDAHVVDVISSHLAIELVEVLTQSNTKKQLLMQQHEKIVTNAKRSDSQEDSPAPLDDGSWLTSRI